MIESSLKPNVHPFIKANSLVSESFLVRVSRREANYSKASGTAQSFLRQKTKLTSPAHAQIPRLNSSHHFADVVELAKHKHSAASHKHSKMKMDFEHGLAILLPRRDRKEARKRRRMTCEMTLGMSISNRFKFAILLLLASLLAGGT